ncbi:hypothetical protein E0H39_21635 [Rhizobium leguminosarum bv. viciae]|nr:hypothetical protein CHR56_31285 [Rhizobium leguminosarum bv. viciae]RWX30059.1 hypothetical protein EHH54_30415 [Rhizobium leguminosarum]NKJ80507.1 hypothetical protein [Rhizobium leguminosarum bv. viciae]NKK13875.1 hypothetical protein [Rhizobium leguminosarum bv. viciae]NKK28621.1 hypothetical protein [Rhizobium leguminosarum bv. viciae]
MENLLFEQSHTVLKMRIALTGEIGMASPVLLEGGLQIIWSLEDFARQRREQDSRPAITGGFYSPVRLQTGG